MQKAGFFKTRRFYCSNETGCDRALKDNWYSLKEFKQCAGKCSECESDLEERGPLSASRKKWGIALASSAFAVSVAYGLYLYYRPYPADSVTFKNMIVYVKAGSSAAPIGVERNTKLLNKISIKYHTVDSTALAGTDYADTNGILVFDNTTNNLQTISIPLLGNKDFDQNARAFSLILTNVENTPEAKIIIQPVVPEKTSISAAEALVSSLSVTAENVGRYHKRKLTLNNLIPQLKTQSIIDQMIQQYKINEGNLTRHREKYYGLLKDLSNVEYKASMVAIDNRINSLDRLGNTIQHDATMKMKQHFEQVAKTGIYEMDLWAIQLSEVIPSPDTPKLPKESGQESLELRF